MAVAWESAVQDRPARAWFDFDFVIAAAPPLRRRPRHKRTPAWKRRSRRALRTVICRAPVVLGKFAYQTSNRVQFPEVV